MQKQKDPMIRSLLFIGNKDFDPELLTKEIGFKPDKITIKGRKIAKNGPPEPATEWIIETGLLQLWDVDDSISELLERIWPVRKQ